MTYTFADDWFSPNLPNFTRFLLDEADPPLAGSPCRLLEVGAHEGRATTWLADNLLAHPESRLDTLDLTLLSALHANVAATGRAGQISLYEGNSEEILRQLPMATYDFIYVDASHQTIDVLTDAVLAFALAKPGSLIAFDDYEWDHPPWNEYGVPKPALDAFLSLYAYPERYKPVVSVLLKQWQLWVRKLSRRPWGNW
jgi:predicted O-methyltransferase YrrM